MLYKGSEKFEKMCDDLVADINALCANAGLVSEAVRDLGYDETHGEEFLTMNSWTSLFRMEMHPQRTARQVKRMRTAIQ